MDLVWTFCLMLTMDWGEFYYLRMPMLVALPICFFLTIRFVDEFLAVRALGIFGLLAAAPILDAAFLQPPVSRLLVVVLAYVYVFSECFGSGCRIYCAIKSAGYCGRLFVGRRRC